MRLVPFKPISLLVVPVLLVMALLLIGVPVSAKSTLGPQPLDGKASWPFVLLSGCLSWEKTNPYHLKAPDVCKRLNRDIENAEKELYTVDRQQGDIDLTVDHRLLSETGREQIKKDVKDTQEFGEDIGRATSTLINDERASISRFWTNLEDNVKVTELKNLVVSDGQLNQLLKSSDPKENAEGKQQLVALAQRQLGLSPEQVSKLFFFDSKKVDQGSLADNNPYVDVKGATILDGEYQGRIGIDVGEKASDEDILNSLGHEAYEGATLANGEVNDDAQEALADAYGAQLSDRISQAIEETGGGDTSTSYNTVNTLEGSRVVTQGNEIAIAVGDAAVDYRQLQRVEVDWIATHAPQFAAEVCRSGRECITVEEAENRLTQQAFSRVQYGTGKRDTAANKFLRRGLGHLIPSDPDHAEAGPFSLFYATPEQRANINIYVNQAEDVIDAYQQAGIEQPSLQAILDDAKEHGEYSEQMAKNLIVGSLAIGGLVLAPIAASTATAAELAAFASNPVNYCLGNPIGCTIGAEEVALAVTGVAAPSSLVPSVVTKLDDVIEGVIRTGDDAAKAAIKTRVPEEIPKVNARDELTGPYSPNNTRVDLEASNGSGNVQSTTVVSNPRQTVNSDSTKNIEVIKDNYGNKAVRVKYKDPSTGESKTANISYDSQRGLPIFDDHSKYTTSIKKPNGYESMTSSARKSAEMRAATRDLRDQIKSGNVDASQFTQTQLKAINSGKENIPDYTWHHNAQSSPKNMQLLPKDVHDAAKHIGEASLSEGR